MSLQGTQTTEAHLLENRLLSKPGGHIAVGPRVPPLDAHAKFHQRALDLCHRLMQICRIADVVLAEGGPVRYPEISMAMSLSGTLQCGH